MPIIMILKRQTSIDYIAIVLLSAALCIVSTQAKIQAKATILDSAVSDVAWCSAEDDAQDKMIVVLTEDGSVYRSQDKGFSWNK
jgi:predicted patatin/cPLA2 family phospholipase